MSYSDFINQLKPIHSEEQADWEEAKRTLLNARQVVWSAGSGLDCSPLFELQYRSVPKTQQAPLGIREHLLGQKAFIFSDYSTNLLSQVQRLYDDLDDIDPKDVGFRVINDPNPFNFQPESHPEQIVCEEIIPLQLFEDCEYLRSQYPNIHSSATTSSVPSDRWHATYLELFIDCAGMPFLQPVLLLHLENLLCLEQVFAQYQIPIDVFYAKRVAGKSGSWEFVHSTDSLFMKAVCQMKSEVQPKLWAADIPDFCSHEGQAFGVASWYHPQWSTNPQQVQWKHIP